MKKITLSLFSLLMAGSALPVGASASELMVAAAMQRCTTNEECVLVTNSCQDNCGFVPVNKENMQTLQNEYQARCGKPMEANPTCNMNPPISAACINSRCTIDYAYKNNGSAGDYQPGAYAVPEAPAPSKVKGDYTKIDDRHGFTAYDLPQAEVKEKTVGTLHTTVYVPPSAPVSGGNYVPVDQAAPMAPGAVPANVPPAAIPTDTTYATPPVTTPAAPPVATPPPVMPVQEPAVTPTMAPPAAAAPVDVPAMTPSLPNQLPPGSPDAAMTAPAVPATPTAQPYEYVAPETVVTAPQPPPPPAVPVAPPGSKPIPPSDLKPTTSMVPPPGGTIPVNPEDPGAPPPEGTKIILKGSEMETTAGKSFSAAAPSEKKTKKLGEFN